MDPDSSNLSLHLPRILCFHGGGSNATIFRFQCRVLRAHLRSVFRLCFVEAPFESEPGPDVTLVYRDYGPFRRWICWKEEHPRYPPADAVRAIETAIQTVIEEDNSKGATGEFVGVLGFSQGARLAASLLYRQQLQAEAGGKLVPLQTSFQFGVLLAGRGPLVILDSNRQATSSPLAAGRDVLGAACVDDHCQIGNRRPILRVPTLHVHGLQDEGLAFHRSFLQKYHSRESTVLLEWDGMHRVPIESGVVASIVQEMLRLAERTGALSN
ncbi:uncharacterized protein P174DRAFT_360969 [Aspergillus novofumigatus IBT 16806]|uniref:Serine hydrolase domain-containing protein n=1 Tax=Aspergillus novofumigatus (strain IBT 16806) TaxID=1392255 RepID=A0A2I1CPP5_ASPN1|nr:uncharacterized protein P174DRAFT_360969 [Aspergillus novofumigatus IBT 16806]PKX99602.1 hypothetical protein P174DRAFT_360969 [Aspergillus novofumigatus IBT 16806]